jgi:hypothetical protein
MEKTHKKFWLFLSLVLLVLIVLPNYVRPQIEEYIIKAVFLERFARFVEWPPEDEEGDTTDKFVITVIGNNPFKTVLDSLYEEKNIKSKEVRIRYISRIKDINNTDILFISESEQENLSDILLYTDDKPILTVGDTEGFAEKGVHVNFFLDKDKIRFEINEKAARASGLYISHLLLNLAKIVE